jgi:hypothetical protein
LLAFSFANVYSMWVYVQSLRLLLYLIV